MIEVRPYQPEDYDALDHQPSQIRLSHFVTPELAAALVGPHAFTAHHEGRVLACAGVIEMWPDRAMAWAWISSVAGPYFAGVHRAVRRFLDVCPFRRVELTVLAGFEPGMRWARMLGFTLETPEPMRAYGVDGCDYYLWARVR